MTIRLHLLTLLLIASQLLTLDYNLSEFLIYFDYSPSSSTFTISRKKPETPVVSTSSVIPQFDVPSSYAITNNGVVVLAPPGTVFSRLEIEDSLCSFPIYCASVNSPPPITSSGSDTLIHCNATGIECELTSLRLID